MRSSSNPSLSEAAYAVLRDVTITPISMGAVQVAFYHAKINSGQLDRPLYEEVNEVLTRIGGLWKGGKTAAHVFPAEIDPRCLLDAVIQSGIMPDKNPHSFFPTPLGVATLLVSYARIGPDAFPPGYKPRLLEPSAGRGMLAEIMHSKNPDAVIDCIEIDPINCAYLAAKGLGWIRSDFLRYCTGNVHDDDPVYDGVVMNPPFSVKGNPTVYIDHILHAWALLLPGGRLVSIAPVSLQTSVEKKIHNFRTDFLDKHGRFLDYDGSQAFKESGTGVATCMILMEKPSSADSPAAGREQPAVIAEVPWEEQGDPFAEEEDPFSDEVFERQARGNDGHPDDPLPPAHGPADEPEDDEEVDPPPAGDLPADRFAEPVWEAGFLGICKKNLWQQTTLLHNALTGRKNHDKSSRESKAILREWDFVQAAEPGWRPMPKSKAGYGSAIQYDLADPAEEAL